MDGGYIMLTNKNSIITAGSFNGCKVIKEVNTFELFEPGFYITDNANYNAKYFFYIFYGGIIFHIEPYHVAQYNAPHTEAFYQIDVCENLWVWTVMKRLFETNNLIRSFIGELNLYEKIGACRCDICGEYHTRLNCIDDKKLCGFCIDNNYIECSRCGSLVSRDDVETTKDGYKLCKMCAKREYVLPYHRYYPTVKFYGNDKDNTLPYLGVELEIDNGGELDSNVKILVNMMNKDGEHFVYCSHDGSLNNGFEIITQPATLEYHMSIKSIYQEAFKKLRKMEYLSHDTTTCGFHVHFNRSFFAENETENIGKLIYLVNHFWNKFVIFARRPEFRMDRYSKKINMDTNRYISAANKTELHEYHYYAINIANPDTIEFRMFKGTLNVNTFLATLQFVHNCIVTAREKSASEIQNMRFEELVSERIVKKYWNRRIEVDGTEE